MDVAARPGDSGFKADYLLWWTKGTNLPPLVTTSGTDQSGVLGPGTTVLFGDTTAENRARSGADLTLGMWLNCCQTWGIEGNYFTLGRLSAGFRELPVQRLSPIGPALLQHRDRQHKTRSWWPIPACLPAG